MKASEFQSSRKFAQTAFGRIAYVERGNGPVALFVHALPLCGYQWRYALDEVSSMRTCVAPDLMGLGLQRDSHRAGYFVRVTGQDALGISGRTLDRAG